MANLRFGLGLRVPVRVISCSRGSKGIAGYPGLGKKDSGFRVSDVGVYENSGPPFSGCQIIGFPEK